MKKAMNKKMNEIDKLYEEAENCPKIKDCYCQKVKLFVPKPDQHFGRKNIKVLFISKQPGPETVRTGKISPDNDYPTAKRFKKMLEFAELKIPEVFCTNARICLPFCALFFEGHTKTQIKNCSEKWLKRLIKELSPKLIVSLGNEALYALKQTFQSKGLKKYKLGKNGPNSFICNLDGTDYEIYSLYHLATKATGTKSIDKQKKDWEKIKVILKNL